MEIRCLSRREEQPPVLWLPQVDFVSKSSRVWMVTTCLGFHPTKTFPVPLLTVASELRFVAFASRSSRGSSFTPFRSPQTSFKTLDSRFSLRALCQPP